MKPPPSFRLFARLAVAGLVAFLLISFILIRVWMTTFEERLIYEAKERTSTYVALVGHMLKEADLRGVKKGRDWETFRQKISHLLTLSEIVRIKVYASDGQLIWSDSRELLEAPLPPSKNPELLRSLEGRVEANISDLHKEEHRFERGNFRTLMELYVPIYAKLNKDKNKPSGVAELYLDVDPLFATIRDTKWLIGITVIGGLALLLLITYISLGRAVGVVRRQNEDLQRALQEIFRANRRKDEIMASLRNELRNPDAIMSYADLLSDGALKDLPQRARPPLEKLRSIAAELLAYSTRILELARLKAGDVLPKKAPVDLGKLLADITSDLGIFCTNGTVSLKLDVPSNRIIINSDRKLLQQILFDLMTNAIKYTIKGEIRVSLQPDPEEKSVKVVVEDTGLGIKAHDLAKIFDEFYRANDPHARFKSGVGLGLPIVKKSVDLLGGRIQAQSQYGKGTTFTVTLPKEP